MLNKKNIAFTFAEVLLTLLIIGVVAALTIPPLKEKSDKTQYLSLLQKAYSTASSAFIQLQAEYGPPLYWRINDDQRVFVEGESQYISTMLKRKMNVGAEKDVIPNDYEIKLLSGSKFKSDTKIDETMIDIKSPDVFQTADGMLWFPSKTYTNCSYEKGPEGNKQKVRLCSLLLVDTNGLKKPNRFGIDVFVFDMTTEGVKPHYSETDDCASLKGDNNNGYTCSAKALSGANNSLDFIYD